MSQIRLSTYPDFNSFINEVDYFCKKSGARIRNLYCNFAFNWKDCDIVFRMVGGKYEIVFEYPY